MYKPVHYNDFPFETFQRLPIIVFQNKNLKSLLWLSRSAGSFCYLSLHVSFVLPLCTLPLWPYRNHVCVCVCLCVCFQPSLTLCNPMDCSPLGFCSWNFPGRNTAAGCHSCSRRSSPPRDWTWVSCVSCIGRWILYHCTTCEALNCSHTNLLTEHASPPWAAFVNAIRLAQNAAAGFSSFRTPLEYYPLTKAFLYSPE